MGGMSWQEPPLLQRYLLEEPATILITLILMGIILLQTAYQRRRRRPAVIGVVTLVIAMGLWTVSTMVVTQREKMVLRCRALVTAVMPQSPSQLGDLLAHDARLVGQSGYVRFQNGQVIESKFGTRLEQLRIQGHGIVDVIARMAPDGRKGQIILDLRTHLPANVYPKNPRTVWQLTWRLGDDGKWRIIEVKWLKFEGRNPPIGLR